MIRVDENNIFELATTNKEVDLMLIDMIREWFSARREYKDFLKALFTDDLYYLNEFMSTLLLQTISYYDTTESFYHGLMLGLLVDLRDRYLITSNRESGLGRYDIILEPTNPTDHAIIMEFKLMQPGKEMDLQATARAALAQIEEKNYATELITRGISKENIYCYGFAFSRKNVLILSP